MRKLLFLAVLLAACHKDSPVGTFDLAAPQAPPDLSAAPPPAPLLTLDGKKVDLAAYRKRVTFIAFWGTYCEPCLQEMPLLEALHQKTKDDTDLALIGVSLDPVESDGDRAHVAEVAAGLKVTFPMLIDSRGVLTERFAHKDGDKARSLPDGGDDVTMAAPTTVLLLADGHYSRHSGFNPKVAADTFVSDGLATIARAETGVLPTDDYDDSPAPRDANGGTFKVMLPAIPKADFAARWPVIQKQLKSEMHLDEKALADAEGQLKTGRPALVEIAPPEAAGSPKKQPQSK